jgi:signal transduction histidine kinase
VTDALSVQVWAAPDAIVQTLINLLSNAVKYSAAGDRVWVTATLLDDTQPPGVLVSVQDQGRGIPAEKLESIFDRFQQVDSSDSREKSGTGLGLAICKNIIQQHGERIWAESSLGQGSIFYFTLSLETQT